MSFSRMHLLALSIPTRELACCLSVQYGLTDYSVKLLPITDLIHPIDFHFLLKGEFSHKF